jgi:hypothetical protein
LKRGSSFQFRLPITTPRAGVILFVGKACCPYARLPAENRDNKMFNGTFDSFLNGRGKTLANGRKKSGPGLFRQQKNADKPEWAPERTRFDAVATFCRKRKMQWKTWLD